MALGHAAWRLRSGGSRALRSCRQHSSSTRSSSFNGWCLSACNSALVAEIKTSTSEPIGMMRLLNDRVGNPCPDSDGGREGYRIIASLFIETDTRREPPTGLPYCMCFFARRYGGLVFLSPFVWRERLPIHCRTRYAFSIAAPLGKRLRPRPNTGGLNAGRRA